MAIAEDAPRLWSSFLPPNQGVGGLRVVFAGAADVYGV
jgi:hypothetical protein